MIASLEDRTMAWSPEATAIMRRIVASADTDILILNAPIERPRDRRLIKLLTTRACRENLLMILVTNGGDPDVAYRIARCIQNHYTKFTVCVSGVCKSAGTLLLLGANELAFSEHGEIGPLDIQMAKKDDLWESESGLTVITALAALSENAQDAFDHFLLSLTARSGGRITVRTASEIAAKLTQALYAPIAEQIDPIHMGEVKRSMAIAKQYGERLLKKSELCDAERLNILISGYPSHSFVIDREEAKDMFKQDAVRDCTEDELALLEDIDNFALL
ncbi:MAG TPA: hypothetical protein VGP62_04700, partial [Bryobacteraceae bacterium]|nr:hypothetical protein [Bryobacteraceae bacterium]